MSHNFSAYSTRQSLMLHYNAHIKSNPQEEVKNKAKRNVWIESVFYNVCCIVSSCCLHENVINSHAVMENNIFVLLHYLTFSCSLVEGRSWCGHVTLSPKARKILKRSMRVQMLSEMIMIKQCKEQINSFQCRRVILL